MNDEIKEIIEYLKNNIFITDETKRKYKILHRDEVNKLLDYITNLQQENHELKSKLECYENGAYYSSKVDELEQENERLKERIAYLERSNDRREDTILGLRQELYEKEDEDKDIPLIPDDELIILKQEKAIDMQKAIDYNFKVLKEKINQVVKVINNENI